MFCANVFSHSAPKTPGVISHNDGWGNYPRGLRREDHMARVVETILPTTMVGSYPRPHWYRQQLLGRDVRVAFKEVQHEEVYDDAVATVIRDQEEAGLDIVTDGNMWYDDYVGVIGSFCWYLYERIDGFEAAKEEHPSTVGLTERNMPQEMLHDWGGVVNNGPVGNSR